jgi:HD-GYP domain-containing protein (c-di-GMP phosphodiesterase class II)
MVRMADIIKKVEQRKTELEKTRFPEQSAAISPPEPVVAPVAETKPVPPAVDIPKDEERSGIENKYGLRVARGALDRSKGLSNEESIQVYMKVLGQVSDIYNMVKDYQEITDEDARLKEHITTFVDQQLLNNDNIIGLISLPGEKDYLYNHVVNVSLISIEIGIGLGYPRDYLIELGMAAVLYDIGMVRFFDLYNKPRQLSPEELEKIKQHTEASFEILDKFKNINKRVAIVAYQQHERQDGSGYPCKLKGDSIDEYVKIISVADVYDALTHPRAYRTELQPYEALNHIIKIKDQLGPKGVRAFIERICCPYPIGCYVKLSSGEKGMVVGRNIGSAFRPIVEIIYNIDKESPEMTRIIDLKKNPAVNIKDYLTRQEIEEMF